MASITKEEGIALLKNLKEQLAKITEVPAALELLALAGKSVGYKPAFRALVMGVDPEQAIKWS